jgi:hypothetical protein
MKEPTIVTRIFITEAGDLIVTDLWEGIEKLLEPIVQPPPCHFEAVPLISTGLLRHARNDSHCEALVPLESRSRMPKQPLGKSADSTRLLRCTRNNRPT